MARSNGKISADFKSQEIMYDLVIDQQVYKYYITKKSESIKNWYAKNSIILDVGCGTGAYTISLADKCKLVVGVDTSTKMINRALSKAKRLRLDNTGFVLGDVTHLPFRDKIFDLVLSVNLFHHIGIEKIIERGILEKIRCTKHGKHVLLYELNPNSLGWSKNTIPKLIRGFVFTIFFPFRQRVIDHDEKGTKILNMLHLVKGIKQIKICLTTVGGFIPPFCPKFLFKSFVLLENILERTPILRRYGAHMLIVGEAQ